MDDILKKVEEVHNVLKEISDAPGHNTGWLAASKTLPLMVEITEYIKASKSSKVTRIDWRDLQDSTVEKCEQPAQNGELSFDRLLNDARRKTIEFLDLNDARRKTIEFLDLDNALNMNFAERRDLVKRLLKGFDATAVEQLSPDKLEKWISLIDILIDIASEDDTI